MNLRMTSLLSVLALLLSATSMNAQVQTAAPTAPKNVAAPDAAMTTVLPPEEAAALFKFYFDADSLFGKQDRHHRVKETYWIPAAADVAGAEAALAAYPKLAASPKEFSRPQVFILSDYLRQYAGVARGDKKLILINGLSASGASNFVTVPSSRKTGGSWHNRAILVFDGGFGFFHAAYDPVTHQIQHLEFNGFA